MAKLRLQSVGKVIKNFKLQRGFVLGVTAVAVLAVAIGGFIRMQSISADTTTTLAQFKDYTTGATSRSVLGLVAAGQTTSEQTLCDKNNSNDTSALTAAEASVVGANGLVYVVHDMNQSPYQDFRVAVGAQQVASSGTGGTVQFTIYFARVQTAAANAAAGWSAKSDKFFLVFNNTQYLEFDVPGGLNLPIGEYHTLSLTAAVSDYTTIQSLNLEYHSGSGSHFDYCISSVMNLTSVLNAATATATNTATSTSSATTMTNGLEGDYFSDQDLNNNVFTRLDSNVNFNWTGTAPSSALTSGNFSTRWTGYLLPNYSETYTLSFTHSNQTFNNGTSTINDDGERVWVNGTLYLDNWASSDKTDTAVSTSTSTTSGTTETDSFQIPLTANTLYSIKIEYFNASSAASVAELSWQSPSQASQIIPNSNLFTSYNTNPLPGSGIGLQGNYFSDMALTNLFDIRTDPTIDFPWGTAAPIAGMPANQYSVRWTGQVQPEFSELYTFLVNAKDGVRLWVNDQLLIDGWQDQTSVVQYSGQISLTAGQMYDITLEYYKDTGSGGVELLWKSPSQTEQVIPMSQLYTTSATPTPTATTTLSPGANQIEVKHGFNAVYVPDDMSLATTDNFTALGMTAFAYNRTGNKLWSTDVRTLNHSIGYYIYNPLGDQIVDVSLIGTTETPQDKFITAGWNLLANGSSSAVNLTNMSYYVSTGCSLTAGEVSCATPGVSTHLSDLLNSKRAYGYIYIIKDPYAADAADAFDMEQVTSDNVNSIQIPAGELFWFYLYN